MIEWATFFADYYLGNFGFSNTVYVFMIWLQCGVAIGFLQMGYRNYAIKSIPYWRWWRWKYISMPLWHLDDFSSKVIRYYLT